MSYKGAKTKKDDRVRKPNWLNVTEVSFCKESKKSFFIYTDDKNKNHRYEFKNLPTAKAERKKFIEQKLKQSIDKETKFPLEQIKKHAKKAVKNKKEIVCNNTGEKALALKDYDRLKMFDLIFDLKVKGLLDYEIKEQVAKLYDIDSKIFRQLIYTEIPSKIHEIATRQHLDVIKSHSDRYEIMYRKFMEMHNHKIAIKCLKYKEIVQGILSDEINIDIDNISINETNDLDFSILESHESDRLDKILSQLGCEISDGLDDMISKELYKRSYYEFFKDAFKILHAGEPYNDNWHIEYLCNQLQAELERIRRKEVRKQDLIVNMPFRAAKSMVCSVIFPVWAWTIDPSMKFICVSYGADLALELATKSKDLMNSEWFQRLYGKKIVLKKDQNEKGFYANTWGGFRKSVGTGGSITGSGCDIMLCLPKGQKIMTNFGEIDVFDIVENKMDVKILSYNHNSNETEYKKIVRYDKNKGRGLVKVTTESGREIICTLEHEIWTENRGYVMAKDLSTDDIVLSL